MFTGTSAFPYASNSGDYISPFSPESALFGYLYNKDDDHNRVFDSNCFQHGKVRLLTRDNSSFRVKVLSEGYSGIGMAINGKITCSLMAGAFRDSSLNYYSLNRAVGDCSLNNAKGNSLAELDYFPKNIGVTSYSFTGNVLPKRGQIQSRFDDLGFLEQNSNDVLCSNYPNIDSAIREFTFERRGNLVIDRELTSVEQSKLVNISLFINEVVVSCVDKRFNKSFNSVNKLSVRLHRGQGRKEIMSLVRTFPQVTELTLFTEDCSEVLSLGLFEQLRVLNVDVLKKNYNLGNVDTVNVFRQYSNSFSEESEIPIALPQMVKSGKTKQVNLMNFRIRDTYCKVTLDLVR